MQVGLKVKGIVTSVTKYGVFIRLKNSTLSGLCHVSEVVEARVADLTTHYTQGDHVRAVILKLDADKKRISLGLKQSYFADEHVDVEEDGVDSDAEDAEQRKKQQTRDARHREMERQYAAKMAVQKQEGVGCMEHIERS